MEGFTCKRFRTGAVNLCFESYAELIANDRRKRGCGTYMGRYGKHQQIYKRSVNIFNSTMFNRAQNECKNIKK